MEYIEYLNEYLNLPIKVAIVLTGIFLALQLIGKFLDVKGKAVPEIMRIRKYFERKKKERETFAEVRDTLEKVKTQLEEINLHYSTDNITKRDAWMGWVNHQAEIYDTSIAELKKGMDKNNEITLSLLIESKRNTIINFASFVIDEKNPVTREQFNRIFKIYEEYEEIIESNGLTNGEVDVAIRIINESYEAHMRNHSFIEDIRGYINPVREENYHGTSRERHHPET